MPSLIFGPSATIEECTVAGWQFGKTWANRPRAEFEEALIQRIAAIDELAPRAAMPRRLSQPSIEPHGARGKHCNQKRPPRADSGVPAVGGLPGSRWLLSPLPAS
jgi:hypothetical protein